MRFALLLFRNLNVLILVELAMRLYEQAIICQLHTVDLDSEYFAVLQYVPLLLHAVLSDALYDEIHEFFCGWCFLGQTQFVDNQPGSSAIDHKREHGNS